MRVSVTVPFSHHREPLSQASALDLAARVCTRLTSAPVSRLRRSTVAENLARALRSLSPHLTSAGLSSCPVIQSESAHSAVSSVVSHPLLLNYMLYDADAVGFT